MRGSQGYDVGADAALTPTLSRRERGWYGVRGDPGSIAWGNRVGEAPTRGSRGYDKGVCAALTPTLSRGERGPYGAKRSYGVALAERQSKLLSQQH